MQGPGSVLLIDDEETFRESTSRLLRQQGLECHCAGDGDEAVKALRDRRFNVMIADIRMPGNPDLRVVNAARELDGQMPVVLITGYPSTETAIRGIDLAVAAYLTKPVDFDELLGHVRSAIDRCQKRRALAAVRERLQTCLADLEKAGAASGPGADGGVETVSMGTIRTLAACLSELLRLYCVRPGVDRGPRGLCELLDCPQRPAHREAILQTIEVLRQTKGTFKSKALADLRRKLEDIVGQGGNLLSSLIVC